MKKYISFIEGVGIEVLVFTPSGELNKFYDNNKKENFKKYNTVLKNMTYIKSRLYRDGISLCIQKIENNLLGLMLNIIICQDSLNKCFIRQ